VNFEIVDLKIHAFPKLGFNGIQSGLRI